MLFKIKKICLLPFMQTEISTNQIDRFESSAFQAAYNETSLNLSNGCRMSRCLNRLFFFSYEGGFCKLNKAWNFDVSTFLRAIAFDLLFIYYRYQLS